MDAAILLLLFGIPIFQTQVINSTTFSGVFQTKDATNTITVNWGDGTAHNTYVGTSDQAFTHTYASGTTTYNVKIYAANSSVLTKISVSNGNLGGTLSLPSGMTSFACYGSNTLSGYTPSTKASNQQRFYLLTTGPGMSSTDVDNILIDYAAAGGTWQAPKDLEIQGTSHGKRTAASNAAYATLLAALTTLSV